MSQHHPDHEHDRPDPQGRSRDDGARTGVPPLRWAEAAARPPSAESNDVERRIGVLFAKVPAPAAFNAEAQARVAARLRPSSERRDRAGRVWARRRLTLGLAFGTVVVLVSGAVIAGGGLRVWWNRLRPDHGAPSADSAPMSTRTRTRPIAGRPRSDVGGSDVEGNVTGDLAAGDTAQPDPSPPPPEQPAHQEAAPEVSAAATAATREAPTRPSPRPRRRALAARQLVKERPPAVAPSDVAVPRAELPAAGPGPLAASAPTGNAPAPAPNRPAAPEPFMPPPSASWMPAPDPAPRPARGAPTTAPSAVLPSQLSLEARLLNQAMVQLRQRRDGAAALATLNDYFARYPAGMLAGEARVARIDALLLLQRKNEALRALDSAHLEPIGRGQELLVIRGELRARRDCADAVRDFDLALGGAAPAALEERALYGRAVCRRREGNEQGARADAAAYLTRFPGGRFAASMRRLADDERGRTP